MSEPTDPAGPKKKKTRRTFRVDRDLDESFSLLAKNLDLNLTDTFVHILKQALGENTNAFKFLDDNCPALIHAEDGFYCAFKLPRSKPFKLLDGTAQDAAKACRACKELKGLRDQAAFAERLQRSNYTVELPFCAKGGKVKQNLKAIWCPIQGDEKRIEFCKKCNYYRVTYVDARLAASPTNKDMK